MSKSASINADFEAGMRVGVLGAGQLGRMLGEAALRLGVECIFLDPAEEACAVAVGRRLRADFDDANVLDALASACDVITYEFENVPVDSIERLAEQRPTAPGAQALAVAQDRLSEKRLFTALDIPVAAYLEVSNRKEFDAAVTALGLPFVLKTRRMGYDGKGQYVVRSADEAEDAWNALGDQALIAEAFVDFDYEVSVIAVRARNGEIRFYPLSRNDHRDGMLRRATPVLDPSPLADTAFAHTRALMTHTQYVGVMAFEFFVTRSGELLANEIAPRVHNSGHWTIEGAECSQFENHLRAVCGLALGSTAAVRHSSMVNIIGGLPPLTQLAQIPGVQIHYYGKQPRPGRKVGHVTIVAESESICSDRVRQVEALIADY